MNYCFPENLYSEVRIEEYESKMYIFRNHDVDNDSSSSEKGAIIRVYDGTMWYTATTNELSEIQNELDQLALLATPNPDILKNPQICNREVHVAKTLRFDGDNNIRNVKRQQVIDLVNHYVDVCVDDSIEEITNWSFISRMSYVHKHYYSSLGADIEQDMQRCSLFYLPDITVNGNTFQGFKGFQPSTFEELFGHEQEFIDARDKYLDYAHNAVAIEPGDYTCVLSPFVTAMFTHESFGHKSESDFMLNDKTLRDEWVLGKKVGSDYVSICDDGDLFNNGYVPYDDEGTKSRKTWLIKDGVLTGRLHDANSAAVLSEELTGNARAQSYFYSPIVRMTNTYMENGTSDPEDIIRNTVDGIYVDDVVHGTGSSTFIIKPSMCHRIRNGKICEPILVNMISGSVFQALFDIDAVGNDKQLFDTYSCGKNGQGVNVSAGGPTIRVKSLTVN